MFNIKNTLFVVLNSRIKTLDTIIPVLMELDLKKVEIIFFSPSSNTTIDIKKNYVLFECINKLGKLIFFYKDSNKNKYISFQKYFKITKFTLYFCIKFLFNKLDIIYFAPNVGKKKYLKFFRYNVFLFENDSYGHTKFIHKTKFIENQILKGIKINDNPFKLPKQNLVLFSKENYYNLKINKSNPNINFWSFNNVRKSENWMDFLIKNSRKYLKNEFLKNNLDFSESIITISIGIMTKDFGWDKSKTIMQILLTETIEEILNLNLNLPIFIKPYPVSKNSNFDSENDKLFQNIIKKFNYDKFVISNLHPMILAQSSLFMISNSNTSIFADFKIFNVPTIEYAHYSDLLLKETNNKSIRPDWASFFINHDKVQLRNVLESIEVRGKINLKLSELIINKNINNYPLIERLNGDKNVKIKSYEEISGFLN